MRNNMKKRVTVYCAVCSHPHKLRIEKWAIGHTCPECKTIFGRLKQETIINIYRHFANGSRDMSSALSGYEDTFPTRVMQEQSQ